MVLLATDAASEGLNFQQGCWTVIHNELPWNPNRLEQRNGRVDRWGQTHTVEVYNLILEDTLEARILTLLEEKLQRIRKELGNVSDVLSVTGPLDLDTLLMDGMSEAEEHTEASVIAELNEKIDLALQEGRDALDACRAQFLTAPGAFAPQDYRRVEAAEQLTAHALPDISLIEQNEQYLAYTDDSGIVCGWDTASGQLISHGQKFHKNIFLNKDINLKWATTATNIENAHELIQSNYMNVSDGDYRYLTAYSSNLPQKAKIGSGFNPQPVWSEDGRYIAAARNHTVEIWDAVHDSRLLTYRGHFDVVKALAWSLDGSYIASSSADGMVQVWDPLTGVHFMTYDTSN
jgi:hypothetical protein